MGVGGGVVASPSGTGEKAGWATIQGQSPKARARWKTMVDSSGVSIELRWAPEYGPW